MHKETQDKLSSGRPYFNRSLVLTKFFESAPVLMGVVELEENDICHILDNNEAAQFFGTTTDSMNGSLASDMGIDRKNLDYWIYQYRKAEAEERSVTFEYQHRKATLSVKVSFLEKSESGISRFSYVAQDITEMRCAQKNLESANSELEKQIDIEKTKLDCLLKASPVGIAFLDTDLRYELINPVMASSNGVIPQEHLKKKIEEIIPMISDPIIPMLREVLEKGKKIVNWEYESFSKLDQEHRHSYLANYFPVKMNGETIGVGAIVSDITEQVEARNILRAENKSFQEIANTLPQIIWLARPDGHIYWHNEWYYNYTGLKKNNEKWDEEEINPIHPNDIAQLIEKWGHSLETGEATNIYFRVRRHDGEYRWHLSRGVALKDDEGNIVKWIGSNTDVHENRVLLDKLEKEQDARERFVATLSHDLRTPLTTAKMSAQIIARKVSDVDLVTRSAARIVESMNRADIMIRDILDANRIKAGERIALEFGDCNLRTIISEALDDLRTLHGDRFVLKDGQEIEGYWSCNGIRRILENLCNNAIKYGSSQAPVTIILNVEGDHVLLTVHNEGNPIPTGDQKKLFEPYRRADTAEVNKQRGWGLGLTLVKGIAEAHGGQVTVTSSANEGTSFSVKLPKQINHHE